MSSYTLRDYEFTSFSHDLEDTGDTHSHTVRRESNTTYRDEFAFAYLHELSPKFYEQFLHGWSRSFYNPERHLEAIHAYGMKDIPKSVINSTVYQQCVDDTKNRLHSLPRVRALDVLTELDSVPYKSSSSAGYGYTGEKGAYKGFNHDRAIRRAKAMMWSAIQNGKQGLDEAILTFVPDIGYTRTQLTDLREKTKIRNVWGRAFHYILLEGLVASPLIQMFQRNDTFYHIGNDPLLSVPALLSKIAADTRWFYAIDWQQFDATVSRFEIDTAFEIIRELIDFPNLETEACFDISKHLFIHKKIAAPNGKVYWSHKGIPSGSYFTSVIGSIVNKLRVEYLWRMLIGRGPKHCYTQGDDSLCSDDLLVPPEDMARIASQIGWMMNPSKTEYSVIPEEVTFLGRSFVGGMNRRDVKKCLRLLIYPEFPVQTGRISAYRANSIAKDVGGISKLLNDIADRLKRHYGMASEDEVPAHFKRYIM